MVPHTKHRRCSAKGEGSADLLAKMVLYIVDPWGWETARRELWRAVAEACLVAERGVVPFQLLLSGGVLAVPGAALLLLTAL